MTEDRKGLLKQQIEDAFSDVPSPGVDPEELVDNYSPFDPTVGKWTGDAFAGRHWKDMPLEIMAENHMVACGLGQMTLPAFHFYLPGFMMVTLDSPDCDWEGSGSLIFDLAPPEPDSSEESGKTPEQLAYKREVDEVIRKDYEISMGLLSPAQRKAVLDFLGYVKGTFSEEETPDSNLDLRNINRAIAYISSLDYAPMDDKKALLKEQIKEAFADVPYPGDRALDSAGNSQDEEIIEAFRGRHWKDMPVKNMLEKHHVACGWADMTFQAFHFYLPGFMLVTLDRPRCEWKGKWALIHQFAPVVPVAPDPNLPPDEIAAYNRQWESLARRHEVRMALLWPAQRKAVIDFLTYLRDVAECDNPDIGRAIAYISTLKHMAPKLFSRRA